MKRRLLPAVLLLALIPAGIYADDPKPARADAKAAAGGLTGTWLFDALAEGKASGIGRVWKSKLTVAGDSFALSKLMDLSKDLKGKFVLNPTAEPKTIDLKLEELDFGEAGVAMKIPACTLHGIYKQDGVRLTICLSIEVDGKRPTAFGAGDRVALITLVKTPAGFKDLPEEVTVRVTGPNGKPASDVTVSGSMYLFENRQNKDAKREWKYNEAAKTAADGTVKFKYDKIPSAKLVARDIQNGQIGFAALSPASLNKNEVAIRLTPECRLAGTLTCPELQKAAKSIGWTNVYLMHNGETVAACDSSYGKYEFVVPAGDYTLRAYGEDLKTKYATVSVPEGRREFTADPIALTASRFVLLQGRPAPELEGIVGWKGPPVKLADLKGKYVLLEFTGYWCGPCMGSMPVLIELHEKFADKGLAIIGVHVDTDGEVDTAAKLDEKLAGPKKDLWKGKELRFPIAMASGERVGHGEEKARGGPVAQYGILSYPTAILIDRAGIVVGKFHARDAKMACDEIEKLLNAKK